MNTLKNTLKYAGIIALSATMAGCFDGDSKDEVEAVNNPPTAVSFNVITQTEVAISERLAGSDPEGDPLTFAIGDEPTLGTVSISAGSNFTYQPFNEVTGSDSFTYTVTDGQGRAATASVGITIEALQVSFLSQSRAAFSADENDDPLVINGREFTQDVVGQGDYQDLIDGSN
jgi:hypothetical protein